MQQCGSYDPEFSTFLAESQKWIVLMLCVWNFAWHCSHVADDVWVFDTVSCETCVNWSELAIALPNQDAESAANTLRLIETVQVTSHLVRIVLNIAVAVLIFYPAAQRQWVIYSTVAMVCDIFFGTLLIAGLAIPFYLSDVVIPTLQNGSFSATSTSVVTLYSLTVPIAQRDAMIITLRLLSYVAYCRHCAVFYRRHAFGTACISDVCCSCALSYAPRFWPFVVVSIATLIASMIFCEVIMLDLMNALVVGA